MNYRVEIWPLMDLVELYHCERLNLSPPYQRNAIWSLSAQRLLVKTVKTKMPMPSFFLQEKTDGSFEMVDGQQRTRAILAYVGPNGFTDSHNMKYEKGEFDDYVISVYVLTKELSVEVIREFYVTVNKTGAKLERPELFKAEYFDTKFLTLVTELTDRPSFKELGIFKVAQAKRMFDRAFVEELVAQLLMGISDKKLAVDQIFKTDISGSQSFALKEEFDSILKMIDDLNQQVPLQNTRFIQKNDFYTLFGLLRLVRDDDEEDIRELYKVLVFISRGVSPSNVESKVLKEYAFHCITQSNSKKARESRLAILVELLLNTSFVANENQLDVAKYFNLAKSDFRKIGPYFTFAIPQE